MSESTRDKLMSLLSRHDEEHSHEYVVWINDSVFEQADVSGENVERVTRCRDCKHSTADGTVCWNERFTHYEQIGDDYEWGDVPMDTEPDGFCAWASRRES